MEQEIKPKNKKMKILILMIVIILLMILLGTIFLINDSSNKLEKIKDSVVKVISYDEEGNIYSTGSGFCIYKENIIITNFHVIEGANAIKIQLDDESFEEIKNVEIFNYNNDIAILSGDFKLKPLKFSDASSEKVGNEIVVIGSPEGELNVVSTGIISNMNSDFDIMITAPISPGSSGGVLLNKNKKVIGVIYATYNSEKSQNLNYAININYLNEIWEKYNNFEYQIIDHQNYHTFFQNEIETLYTSEFEENYFKFDSINTLYKLTNKVKKFEYTLSKASQLNLILQGIWNEYSYNEKVVIGEIFEKILYDRKKKVEDNKETIYDKVVKTEIINLKYLAMIMKEINEGRSSDEIIDKLHLTMHDFAKIFIKEMTGEPIILSSNDRSLLKIDVRLRCDEDGEKIWYEYFGF